MKWKLVYRIVVSVRKSFFFHHHHHLRLSVFKGNFLFDKFSSSSLDIGGGSSSSSSSSNGGLCRPIGPERQQQQQPEIDDWNVCACVCERERERECRRCSCWNLGPISYPTLSYKKKKKKIEWNIDDTLFFLLLLLFPLTALLLFPLSGFPLSLSLSLSHTQVRKVGGANKKNQKVSLYKKEKKRNPKRFRSTSKADRNGFLFFFPFFFLLLGGNGREPFRPSSSSSSSSSWFN